MSKRPKTAIAQLKVRLDEPLRAKLERSAKMRPPRGLSLNSEIVNRIEQSFDWDKTIIEMRRLTGTIEGVRELMESFGFRKVQLNLKEAIWTEPGVDIRRASESLDAAAIVKEMEPELATLLANAIKKVAQGGKK